MKKWIWIGAVAVVVIFFYATYNGFVNKEEGLKSAWSNVETQYQRRADLIPNLVSTVKGYAAHETQPLNEAFSWEVPGSLCNRLPWLKLPKKDDQKRRIDLPAGGRKGGDSQKPHSAGRTF